MTTETPTETPAETTPAPAVVVHEIEDALKFPFDKIVLRDKNIRSTLPDISELVASIKAEGILEPLIAVPLGDGTAQLVAGYRRYYAAMELKLAFVPVRQLPADENRRHRIALIENLQRSDMNAIDKAVAIAEMIEKEGIEQRHAAKMLGVSDGYISQHLTLLRLPKKIQAEVKSGKLELAHARQLARVKNEEQQLEFLKLAGTLTSAGLGDKVDAYLQKEKEKEDKAAAAEKKKLKAATRKKLGVAAADDDDDDKEPTLAEIYGEKKLEPMKKTEMMDALKHFANKLERAEAETKKAEYKGILKGLEIASGILEFTP